MVSYATEKVKTTSRKIVLVEFDVGEIYVQWENDNPGVWRGRVYFASTGSYGFLTGPFILCPFKNSGTGTITNEEYQHIVDVGSVREDGYDLTKYATYADMATNAGSFYFDPATRIIYVHTIASDWIHEHAMTVGKVYRVTNDSGASELGQGTFAVRLSGLSAINKRKDPLGIGLMQYSAGTFEIMNDDGKYDEFLRKDLFGESFLVKYGFYGNGYSDFITLNRNYIEKWNHDFSRLTFTLRDDRKKLSRKIPIRVFSTSGFGDLGDDDEGKPRQVIYGPVRNVPTVCLNKKSTAGGWIFEVCDVYDHPNGIQAIDTVYVGGIAKTPATVFLADGAFELNRSDWDGGATKVTCDARGVKNSGGTYIENSLDVLTDILAVYLQIPYNSTNYNTTQWAAIKSSTKTAGVCLHELTETIAIIEKICRSNFGYFNKNGEGKYEFLITDIMASSGGVVRLAEEMEEPNVGPDSESLATTIRVGWSENYAEKSFKWKTIDSRRAVIFSKYGIDNDVELETYLTSEADAIEVGNRFYDMYDEAEPVVEIETKAQYMDLDVGAVRTIEMKRVDGRQIIPDIIAELIGISKDPVGGKVKTSWRRLRDA